MNSLLLGLFQKYHRQICLLLLVVFGLASGHLAATLLGITLRPPALEPLRDSALPRLENARQSERDLNIILERNLFDPASRGPRQVVFSRPADADEDVKAAPRGDLALVGTLVAGADSLALVRVGREVQSFRLDDKLAGGGRIEGIERNQVTIRNGDQSLTVLELLEGAVAPAAPRPQTGQAEGIRAVGANTWQVSRATAEAARQNIAQQLRLATMEPRIIDGRTDGFIIKVLNRRSLLTTMGLQRGDVVMKVNGMSLDSPEKALQIMQQLREARQLTVDLERNRQPLTFTYELE